MADISGVSQKVLRQIQEIEQMDGQKGISSAQERNALAEALSNGEITGGTNQKHVQNLINEYDVKEAKNDASKDVINVIKKAMALDGDKNTIDSDREAAVLDSIIDNTTGQYSEEDIKYAKAMKKSFGLSEETQLGIERQRNNDLAAENADLLAENEALEAKNKVLVEQLKAREQEAIEMEAELDKKLAEIGEDNAALKNEISNLKNELGKYKKENYKIQCELNNSLQNNITGKSNTTQIYQKSTKSAEHPSNVNVSTENCDSMWSNIKDIYENILQGFGIR